MSFVARMRKEHADLAEKLNKLHAFRGTAEVILCGLESLADRLFGARPETAGKSGVENSDPGCALGRLHVLTSRLHDRLNRIDAVKNRLVDLA